MNVSDSIEPLNETIRNSPRLVVRLATSKNVRGMNLAVNLTEEVKIRNE